MADHKRPSWDEYFMQIVEAVAARGTCDRGRTGAIIVKDKRIISTGYVGSPPGIMHCDEIGHLMKKKVHEDGRESMHCERTTHAEVNAIALAAKHGISVDGSTLYCKLEPCFTCAKIMITAGIKRVICQKRYHAGQDTRKLFEDAGIQLEVLNDEIEKYENQ